MENVLTSLRELKAHRPNVPLYILVDGIDGPSWVRLIKSLAGVKKAPEVDVILNSPGGLPSFAYKMIRALREKYTVVNIIVPYWAKSAATLVAFGGSKIIFHEYGELGPIDAQVRKDDEYGDEIWSSAMNVKSSLSQIEKHFHEGTVELYNRLRNPETKEQKKKNLEILKLGRRALAEILFDSSSKFYAPLLQKIDTAEMGKMSRFLDIGKMYARRILTQYTATPPQKMDDLLDFLVYECPDHGYVVDYPAIKTSLPFVIRGDEAFGEPYYDSLGKVALSLIDALREGDLILNDFLESFPLVPKPSIIKSTNTKHEKNKKVTTKGSSAGGPGRGPVQNKGKTTPPNRGRKRDTSNS